MLMTLFQPLVSRAMANKVESYPNNTPSKEYFKATHHEVPATFLDNFVFDAEDEDDLSEFDNLASPDAIAIQTIGPAYFYFKHNNALVSISNNDILTYASKPLYILWSVFRI